MRVTFGGDTTIATEAIDGAAQGTSTARIARSASFRKAKRSTMVFAEAFNVLPG
jgi:hypothetical protein